MKAIGYLLPPLLLLFAAGCDQKPKEQQETQREPSSAKAATSTKTYETVHVERAIDAYIKYPSTGNETEVERALAELSNEIAAVQERAGKQKGAERAASEATAQRLIEFQEKEALRFAKAKAEAREKHKDSPLSEKAKEAGEKAKEAAGKAKDVVKEALREAAEATEDAARRAKEKLDPDDNK